MPYAGTVIVGDATATVTVPPSEVIEFVLDLSRYRQADRKIGRVGAAHRDGNNGTVRFSGRIRGLPAPSGVYPFAVNPSGLRFGSPIAGAARWFLDFEGTFDCEETRNGTVVRHRGSSSSSALGGGSLSRCSAGGWKRTPPKRWFGSKS
jgi:hypothetical protein